MLIEHITPRFNDTDALGHISNTTLPSWFEGGRGEVFRWFTPDLDPKQWQLMLAKYEISFHAELFYEHPVEIRTFISHQGNSSFHVYQEAWQQGNCCASGTTVMVCYDHQRKATQPIPDTVRQKMAEHALPEDYER